MSNILRLFTIFLCLSCLCFCRASVSAEERLGWQHEDDLLCEGYFIEPDLGPIHRANTLAGETTTVHFSRSSMLKHHTSILIGNVEIAQAGREIKANRIYLTPLKDQSKPYYADAYGHVQLREPGKLFTARQGHFYFKKHQGLLTDSHYHFALNTFLLLPGNHPGTKRISGLTGWGHAEKIKQIDQHHFRFYNASFSTCNPQNATWKIRASELDLNQTTGRGIAKHSVLRLHDIPVFYWPYFDFPIDKRRKTGFLVPYFGANSSAGFDIQAPLYLNLAPNYDLTFTPRVMFRRGVLWQGHTRYLFPHARGRIIASYINSDQQFNAFRNSALGGTFANPTFLGRLLNASANRGSIAWYNFSAFSPHWSALIDYNWVSDDYFLDDYSTTNHGPLVATDTRNHLPQKVYLNYHDQYNQATLAALTTQTLQPVNQAPAAIVYSRLPEFNWHWQNDQSGFVNLESAMQYVQFRQSGIWPGLLGPPITENRLHFAPSLSLNWHRPFGSIRPMLSWSFTHFQVFNTQPGRQANITRSLPVLSIDNQLLLERNLHLLQRDYTQTLEPRLFYLFIPYQNQFDIPIFDATFLNYTYDSLFTRNRFQGIDRLGDANQVTLGVRTKLLDQITGQEKLNFGIGEIFYFGSQKNGQCLTVGCLETPRPARANSASITASIIAAHLGFTINSHAQVVTDVSWDPESKQFNESNVNFLMHAKQDKILSLGYAFSRNALYRTTPTLATIRSANTQLARAAVTWPLAGHYRLVGSWQHNISQGYLQDYLVGIEYNTCCWSARFVTGKVYDSLNATLNPRYDRHFYIQWQLKGLGTFGNEDPSSLLRQKLPGYSAELGL